MNTIVVTGAAGQLGRALALTAPSTCTVRWLRRADCDLSDPEQVRAHPAFAQADTVINAAAFTLVDAAEPPPTAARRANALAPELLAQHCQRIGARLIHLSTDYVFGPHAPRRPLRPSDPVAPDSVYGATKLAGERAVLGPGATACVVRTAWVYSGFLLPDHRDFVTTMARLAREGSPAKVVDDQHGSPTYSVDLARALWQLAGQSWDSGIIHLAGGQEATWYQLARAVFAAVGADPGLVTPTNSAGYPTPAPRPPWSVLESARELPGWPAALPRALEARL
ncbi:dTDP-4-dehydrorhamnose reductase [Corynebacterium sp. Marseille-Q2516]